MIAPNPHYLLFCNTHITQTSGAEDDAPPATLRGRWHFVLEQLDGTERFEVADSESNVTADRLALLSVVRGLEALEQHSRVTLVTTSRYVARGLRYGLASWRDAGYRWERFGVQKPIRNADLWKRIDSAMSFHSITCRLLNPSIRTPGIEGSVAAEVEVESATMVTDAWQEDNAGEATPASETLGNAAMVARVHDKPSVRGERYAALRQRAAGMQDWLKSRLEPKPALLGT